MKLTREEGRKPSTSIIKIPFGLFLGGVCSSHALCGPHINLTPLGPASTPQSYLPFPPRLPISPSINHHLVEQIGDISSRKPLKQTLYKLFSYKFQVPSPLTYQSIMSDCGNCDCSDKSQCVKKGSSYTLVIETEKISYVDAVAMDAPAAEHDGKCKCGSSCACVNCACGH